MEAKTNCKFCNCVILQRTADATNGYCWPHSVHGTPILDRIQGDIKSYKIVDPDTIDFDSIPEDSRKDLAMMIAKMKREKETVGSSFELVEFETEPISKWTMVNKSWGFALTKHIPFESQLYNNNDTLLSLSFEKVEDSNRQTEKKEVKTYWGDFEWVCGIITGYSFNKSYYESTETMLSLIEYLNDYVDVDDIHDFVSGYKYGDIFIKLQSSPCSWAHRFGREYILTIRDGMIIDKKTTRMN